MRSYRSLSLFTVKRAILTSLTTSNKLCDRCNVFFTRHSYARLGREPRDADRF